MSLQLDLTHLRSFYYVGQHGSIKGAVEATGLSQPTVSAHIKALESAYGRPLLERSPTGVTLSTFGRRLYEEMGPHVQALETIAAPDDRGPREVFLGGPLDFLSMRALPALASIDDVRIRVRPGIADENLKRLDQREIDLYVATRILAGGPWMQHEHLLSEQYVLVAHPRNLDRHAELRQEHGDELLATQALLAESPLLAFDPDLPLLRHLIGEHLSGSEVFGDLPQTRMHERASFCVPDFRALRELAIAGAGIAGVPRYVVADALDAGELVELPGELRLDNDLYVAYRVGESAPEVLAVVERLRAASADWRRDQQRVAGAGRSPSTAP